MNRKQLYKTALMLQGMYIFLTALWPIVDINSFMVITGPKTDTWLVKTVAVSLICVSLFFLLSSPKSEDLVVTFIACIFSFGFAYIDFFYSLNKTIRWVYAIDGIIEILFGILWLYFLFSGLSKQNNQSGKS
jgi:hypothetical protein